MKIINYNCKIFYSNTEKLDTSYDEWDIISCCATSPDEITLNLKSSFDDLDIYNIEKIEENEEFLITLDGVKLNKHQTDVLFKINCKFLIVVDVEEAERRNYHYVFDHIEVDNIQFDSEFSFIDYTESYIRKIIEELEGK